MTMTNAENNYLHDLGREIVSLAKRIQTESQSTEDQFQRGRCFAIYEVLSLMKQQAETFGITTSEIGLEEFDIEKLLK